METLTKFKRNVEKLTAEERKAVEQMFRSIELKGTKKSLQTAAANLVDTFLREGGKRAYNRATDTERRVTIGARVRRSDAARYRKAAQDSDRSVYRFAVDALDAESERVERVPPNGG